MASSIALGKESLIFLLMVFAMDGDILRHVDCCNKYNAGGCRFFLQEYLEAISS